MNPIYKVPVIPNNLRRRETYIQIADALNYLNLVFDDILTRVNKRISDKQNHVAILRGRITKVHEKVQKITKTKKATQVFSNSKYPLNKNNEMYKSIFGTHDGAAELNLIKTKLKLKEQLTVEPSNNILQFYHVKVKKDSSVKSSSMSGLGRFPQNAKVVNELLLFNTHKNPYKHYEMMDPLSNNTSENIRQEESNIQGPDAAPLSMTQRGGAVREPKDNYFYSPDLGEVPSIDVPLDLPNLPGVADDLRYLMDMGPGIAPSVTTTPLIPELPQITPSTPSVPQPITPDKSDSAMEITSPDESTIGLPDHLPELPIKSESFNVVNNASLPTFMPEESIQESTLEETVTDRPVFKPSLSTDVASDARASLMEAIRQAGKKNQLHSVKEDVANPKKVYII